MTRAVMVHRDEIEQVSDREFFSRIFGHPPRTKEQHLAEWQTEIERLADLIEQGCELSEYGNPAVRDAKLLVAGRQRAAHSDPLLKRGVA